MTSLKDETTAVDFDSPGHQAKLGAHNLCWSADGYDNDWDYAIRVQYKGASTLRFRYLLDSEPGFDDQVSDQQRLQIRLAPDEQHGDVNH